MLDSACDSEVNKLSCNLYGYNPFVTLPLLPLGASSFIDAINQLGIDTSDVTMDKIEIFIEKTSGTWRRRSSDG
jgi:hypothetical protein